MTVEQAVPLIIVVTTALVTVADWLIRRWLQKHHDELILTLSQRVADLQTEVNTARTIGDDAKLKVIKLTDELTTASAATEAEHKQNQALGASHAALTSELANLSEDRDALNRTQKAYDSRIRRALELEGEIWTQRTMAGTYQFRLLTERRTPIISVLNLKGGVGKTTLTAYLAWALSARGYRVLLVDLDLQRSLSSLFVPSEELSRFAKHDHKLLQHFLADVAANKPSRLLDFTLPLPVLNPHCRLVATTDRLAYAELSQTFQWLLRVGGTKGWSGRKDGRMILRRALHSKGLYKKFDIILIDCPPFLNLCCANALAASDYVLTPIMPSVKSIERVTPLLQRVMEMQQDVNQHLKMLGLVVNSSQEQELTAKEQDLLLDLPRTCLDVYGHDVYQFDTTVPQRVVIRDGESSFVAPDDRHALRTTFEALAEEFLKRLPAVCRQPHERGRKRRSLGEM